VGGRGREKGGGGRGRERGGGGRGGLKLTRGQGGLLSFFTRGGGAGAGEGEEWHAAHARASESRDRVPSASGRGAVGGVAGPRVSGVEGIHIHASSQDPGVALTPEQV
jgi:hypothetical protein